MMRAAGAEHRDTAGTLLPVAFNLGIALGAAAGSAVVDRFSLGPLPVLATALAVLATAGLAATARAAAPARRAGRTRQVPGRRAARASRAPATGRGDRRGRIMGPGRVTDAPRSEEPCPA
jgi:hypothetical protein